MSSSIASFTIGKSYESQNICKMKKPIKMLWNINAVRIRWNEACEIAMNTYMHAYKHARIRTTYMHCMYGFGVFKGTWWLTQSGRWLLSQCFLYAVHVWILHSISAQVKAHGLAFTHQKSTIVLPPDAFSRSTSSHVSSFVYLTLDKILFLKTQRPGSDSLASRTALVSSTVRPSPPSHLRAPVRIDLEKREVSSAPLIG